ncbi:MAG: peptide chain release factor N(5)-glutamine methyltransferase [Peptococcaceae bacterium]|jgi:release factor glutamine methyltransferase|nr:peptide chain release factor N(5)-glutamine methyltransferase [Peptococcaceae bacterium]
MPDEMTTRELLPAAARLLKSRDPGAARLEAELLLAFAWRIDRPGLYCRLDDIPAPAVRAYFQNLVRRRLDGEPLAYLTGEREFMGLTFSVTPAVLVPRPETELLVATALALLRDAGGPSPRVIDVGTGSGAIAVSLAVHHPPARVTAVDISAAALAVAAANAGRHGVADRLTFAWGDLLADLDGQADLIVANLPYIPSGDLAGLPDDVRREPRLALDGGPDGLDLYRRLVPAALHLLKPEGHLLAELGPAQERAIMSLVRPPHWRARVEKDWAGRPRLLVARLGTSGHRRPGVG